MVLKSRICSYPGGDKYSFVDDVCPQYLHCTDEDQQSETARLSTVERLLIVIDRNGFRITKEEGQIYTGLPQIF